MRTVARLFLLLAVCFGAALPIHCVSSPDYPTVVIIESPSGLESSVSGAFPSYSAIVYPGQSLSFTVDATCSSGLGFTYGVIEDTANNTITASAFGLGALPTDVVVTENVPTATTGQLAFTGTVGNTTGTLQLTFTATTTTNEIVTASVRFEVQLTPPEPEVVTVTPPGGTVGGCIQIAYALRDLTSRRVNVLIEFDDGGGFERCSQAPSPADRGLYGLLTNATSSGVAHTFAWDSWADMPHVDLSSVTIRITAYSDGGSGGTPSTGTVHVRNLPTFTDQDQPSTGGEPTAIAAADLDQDGDPDFVTADHGDSTISLGDNNSGVFAATTTLAASPGAGPRDVVVADLDNDGELDIATANDTGTSVSIIFGTEPRATVTTDVQANTTVETGAQSAPVVAMDSFGNFVVVWTSPETGNDIRARRFRPDGVPWAASFVVNDQTSGNQDLPDVAMDANGNFVVVWRDDTNGMAQDVFARLFNADGSAVAVSFVVNTTVVAGNQNWPAVSRAPSGEFVVTWTDESGTGDGDGAGIRGQLFTSGGGFNGTEFAVNTTTTGTQHVSDVCMASDLTFAVAFQSPDVSLNGVRARAFTAGGTGVTNDFEVPATTSLDQEEPSIAWDGTAMFIAWQSNALGNQNVMGRIFNAAGTAQTDEFDVPTTFAADQVEVDVSTGRVVNGTAVDFIAVWRDDNDGVIKGRRFATPAGGGVGAEYQLNVTTAGFQQSPGVAVHGSRMAAAWVSPDVDSDGIFARTFRPGAGSDLQISISGTPNALTVADIHSDGDLDLVVASDSATEALVVLANTGGGNFSATPEVINANGTYHGVTVGFVNGDGLPDIVATTDTGAEAWFDAGGGIYSLGFTAALGGQAADAALIDLDRDGDLDAVFSMPGAGQLALVPNSGGAAGSPVNVSSVSGARGLDVGDIDNDGILDVVVAGSTSFGVVVHYGTGSGGFRSSTDSIGNGNSPRDVALADADHDGDLDLLVASTGENAARFVQNDLPPRCLTRFAAIGIYEINRMPQCAGVADFNGDGKLDLAVGVVGGTDQVSIRLGGPEGFSDTVTDTFNVGTSPVAIRTGYLNPDDKFLDLVVVNDGSDNVTVALGNGDGTFGTPQNFGVGALPEDAAVFDVSGDLLADIVVANEAGNSVTILTNDGNGTSFTPSTLAAVGNGPTALDIGDLDGDGITDVLVAMLQDDTVVPLISDGAGTLTPGSPIAVGANPIDIVVGDFDGVAPADWAVADDTGVTFNGPGSIGGSVDELALGDFNEDGSVDLAGVDNATGQLLVWLNNGAGVITSVPETYRALTGTFFNSLLTADADGDGTLDIVLASSASTEVLVYTGVGDGTFYDEGRITAGGPTSICVADFNHDGILDLVVAEQTDDELVYYQGNGDGTFTSMVTHTVTDATVSPAVDFDRDGHPDVPLGRLGGQVEVAVGNGTSINAPTNVTGFGAGTTCAVGHDLDNDGDADLVGTHGGFQSFFIPNIGGSWGGNVTRNVNGTPTGLTVGDLNRDGRADIVTAGTVTELLLMRPDGTDELDRYGIQNLGTDGDPAVFADVNADGRLDVVIPLFGTNVLRYMANTGQGQQLLSFDSDLSLDAVDAVATADVDHDGAPEFFAAGEDTGPARLTTVESTPGGGLSIGTRYLLDGSPTRVVVADFNRDGRPDIAVCSTDVVQILLGR